MGRTPGAALKTSIAIVGVLVLWSIGVAGTVLAFAIRLGTLIELAVPVLIWGSVIGGCWAIGTLPRARWLSVSAVIGAGVLCVVMNVSDVAPRAWFELHRPAFGLAAQAVPDPGPDYYGAPLPESLRWLSATGKVSGGEAPGELFFPQWLGIPDDAGGYFYLPGGGSPEGYDMYGLSCEGAEQVGGGWWMCGM